MKRIALFAALFLALALTAVAVAQSGGSEALVEPLVLKIRQSVPTTVTVRTEAAGEVITTTVPLTVEVSLDVSLVGEQVVAVVPGESARTAAVVWQESVELVDDLGIPFTLEVEEGITLLDLRADDGYPGDGLRILGELRNDSYSDGVYRIEITAYDKDGRIFGEEDTHPTVYPTMVGERSAFELGLFEPASEIGSYRLVIR